MSSKYTTPLHLVLYSRTVLKDTFELFVYFHAKLLWTSASLSIYLAALFSQLTFSTTEKCSPFLGHPVLVKSLVLLVIPFFFLSYFIVSYLSALSYSCLVVFHCQSLSLALISVLVVVSVNRTSVLPACFRCHFSLLVMFMWTDFLLCLAFWTLFHGLRLIVCLILPAF